MATGPAESSQGATPSQACLHLLQPSYKCFPSIHLVLSLRLGIQNTKKSEACCALSSWHAQATNLTFYNPQLLCLGNQLSCVGIMLGAGVAEPMLYLCTHDAKNGESIEGQIAKISKVAAGLSQSYMFSFFFYVWMAFLQDSV